MSAVVPKFTRWLDWSPQDAKTPASATDKTDKSCPRRPFVSSVSDSAQRSEVKPADPSAFEIDTGSISAVLLTGTALGDVWLVADEDVLCENPDILRADLPVLFFQELQHLRGKTPADLEAIRIVKSSFRTGRVLQ